MLFRSVNSIIICCNGRSIFVVGDTQKMRTWSWKDTVRCTGILMLASRRMTMMKGRKSWNKCRRRYSEQNGAEESLRCARGAWASHGFMVWQGCLALPCRPCLALFYGRRLVWCCLFSSGSAPEVTELARSRSESRSARRHVYQEAQAAIAVLATIDSYSPF